MILLSVIIPTRNRSTYLASCLQNCLRIDSKRIEFIILDNCSLDNTEEIVKSFIDSRIRYYKSANVLSMRDNFERGFEYANGEVITFIGDDDGLYPGVVNAVESAFSNPELEALVSDKSRYYWPDIVFGRQDLFIRPKIRRNSDIVNSSRALLYNLLKTGKYQELPCMYYGFVRKVVYDKIIQRQGRFFLSNQPDIYSTITLCMHDVKFSYSNLHLAIAGISGGSNGGRMFTSETVGMYKEQWKAEDDIGFLPGFENWKTINSLIIESALVYAKKFDISIFDILNREDLLLSLKLEYRLRSSEDRGELNQVFLLLGFSTNSKLSLFEKLRLKISSLTANFNNLFGFYFIDLSRSNVKNIDEAVLYVIDEHRNLRSFNSLADCLRGGVKMVKSR